MIWTIVKERERNKFNKALIQAKYKRDRPLMRIKQDIGVKTADAGEDFGGGR